MTSENSDIEVQTLNWTINGYFQKCMDDKELLFRSPIDKNMAKIEFKGDTQSIRGHTVSISIKTEHCVHLIMVNYYRIRQDQSFVEQFIVGQEFSGQSTEWSSPVIIKQFQSLHSFFTKNIGDLILRFKFIFKKNNKIEMNRNIGTDLGAHLMNPAFSDITIKTSEGDEVPAHKILLVARSDVFRAQFQHDTAEKLTNTVECPFETKVVKDLLSYIYLEEVPNIEVTAFNLLLAAVYYHLDPLKELCGHVLTKQLTVNNAVELLTLADAQNISSLKKGALTFLTEKENAVRIVKTEGWKLMSKELAKSMFEFTLPKN